MKKLIALMLMFGSVFFFACEEDETEKLSKEDAVVELNNLDTEMSTYMEEMMNSDGIEAMDALMALMYIDDPFASSKSTKTNVIPTIKQYLLPVNPEQHEKSALEVESFDFDSWVGTYTWNATLNYWEEAPNDPSDKIVLIFPTEGSTTNNATITIYNYEEVEIPYTDYYGTYYDYYPTDVDADLYVDDIKVVDIDLQASWVMTGDNAGDPTSLDISVYLLPFDFTGTFNQSSTSASIDFSINYDGAQIFSAGVDATFESSDMEDPLTIGGYIQLLAVKVEATVDVNGIETIFEDLENQTSPYTTMDELTDAINDEINAVVKVDGAKAADIELLYDETAEEMITVVLVFADGTVEPAEPYFADFATDLEDFFYFLDDIYADW